jgi:hypothetical protein
MSKVKVTCKDGIAEVSCINPLFTNTLNVHNGPTVAELEGVDNVFTSIKNMNSAQSTLLIMSMGLAKVLRLKEIANSLGITTVLRATETALTDSFKALDNPGVSRELFNIANDFDPLENKILLDTFSALLV